MATKPENQYITGLHKHFPPKEVLYREKMANPWRGGTADYWYSGAARDLWIEFKYLVNLPIRSPLVPALSPLQLAWCSERRAQGRDVIVVVGTRGGVGIVLDDPQTWISGMPQAELAARQLKNRDLALKIARHCTHGEVICSHSLRLSSELLS